MKLVIDIPEEQYAILNAKTQAEITCVIDHSLLTKAIASGTPIPKGHGRTIDESKITTVSYSAEKHWIDEKTGYHYFSPSIIRGTDAPTIIEADKEE